MKTIKISPALHRLLKVKAAERDKGLQQVVEEALKKGLGLAPDAVLPETDKVPKKKSQKGQ